ncbi:MAG: hypothetical protein A2063_08820 [Gallionellales bacterium GWA2_60_142]|nr:MAG: hypothetical protein A2063_08820 [Gallionellales bacterium GWA2_60_142]HCI14493.1 hypothetical protein [Gallionellaceae bacterium]
MRFSTSRHSEILRLNRKLVREGFPRLQMSFLVTITGASGFVASFSLLHSGFHVMPWRYLLACMIAYVVFLMLLWLWLRTKAEDYADIPDFSNGIPSHGGGSGECHSYAGNGGEFGGGGASGSFDSSYEVIPLESADAGGPVGDALEAASGADELAIPLFVLILFVALLLSSLYVVYSAPMLFAELLLDGMLAAGLYRRLKGIPRQHWLETSLRRTFWPFLLTALLSWGTGWAMQLYAPEADSIGDVLHYHATQN